MTDHQQSASGAAFIHAAQEKWPILERAIRNHCRCATARLKSKQRRWDVEEEALAVGWVEHWKLWCKGRDASLWPTGFAQQIVRNVMGGRKIGSRLRSNEALSVEAQARRGFAMQSLPDYSTMSGNEVSEALADHQCENPADAAAFNLSFPVFLARENERNRAIISAFLRGLSPQAICERFQLSEGRISQLRREFRQRWAHLTS